MGRGAFLLALRIEKFISGAYGLSRDEDGRVVLVKSALPGELVEPGRYIRRANTTIVEDYEILERSDERTEPCCPHYEKCGGCDFLVVSEKTSAEIKEKIVKENLERLAKAENLPEFEVPKYSSFTSYRARIRVHVDLKEKRIGFLKKGSGELYSIEHCPAITELLNEKLKEKSEILKEAQRIRILSGINKKTGLVEVPLFSGDDEVTLNDKRVTALGYKVSANVFFQSNLKVLPELLCFVKENALGTVIMDLYSGVSTFSRLFEGEEKVVYAVEKSAACLPLAKVNAPSARQYTEDVLAFSKRVRTKVDTCIVDPPRTGLDRNTIPLIESWNPERIIYVSCDSTTASRDISVFRNYRIVKASVFDFYPGSFHEESAFILERR